MRSFTIWRESGRGGRDVSLQSEITSFYRDFDDLIGRIANKFGDSNILLVSDHGHAPYRYNLNLKRVAC